MHDLLTFSLRYRFFTVVAIAVLIASGLWSFAHLTIDAVPDLTPVRVQILTRAPALGPVEVEQFVTFPIEASLNGLPTQELYKKIKALEEKTNELSSQNATLVSQLNTFEAKLQTLESKLSSTAIKQ